MKLHRKAGSKNNYIVTLVIGKSYFNDWQKYSKPSWIKYCNKNDLGLISFSKDLISDQNEFYKKKQWQKLLVGFELLKYNIKIKNICYLDSDILINPLSPNIFRFHKENRVSLVSQFKNIPFDNKLTRKRIAILRKTFYSKKYPLNSALHMSIKEIYKFHNLKTQIDYCCTGLFVINLNKYAKKFKDFYFKYNKNISSITDGGEEAHVNYEIHNNCQIKYLDYRFQALWLFEMAKNYPFLYQFKDNINKLIIQCIESSLHNNYFLHFAGSWYESGMWKNKMIFKDHKSIKIYKKFDLINNINFTSVPAGIIKPGYDKK